MASLDKNLDRIAEFEEVLNAEVVIDLDKLTDLAKHGIPEEVRGETWKYLLGVSNPNKSAEVTVLKQMYQEYTQLAKASGHSSTLRLENEALHVQLSNKQEHSLSQLASIFTHTGGRSIAIPHLTSLLIPFVKTFEKEVDIFFCFQTLVEKVVWRNYSRFQCAYHVAKLSTLFRLTMPELYEYFEEEDLPTNEWALEWVQSLLASALPLQSVTRLWDTYFSVMDDITDLHCYVCLAVLQWHYEVLMDLELSEIRGFLRNLPEMDVPALLTQAYCLRDRVSKGDQPVPISQVQDLIETAGLSHLPSLTTTPVPFTVDPSSFTPTPIPFTSTEIASFTNSSSSKS
eukprot:GCRY01003647.1.p1 GENE.GCRY01003647.1~~GCRY01003647.1.p1  ORF type:complete len:343 (-),score=85.49 GCRY01003647.1:76-1104(-)